MSWLVCSIVLLSGCEEEELITCNWNEEGVKVEVATAAG